MLRPADAQPSRVDTSDPTGYPHGKAKNVTTPGPAGTNDGTAWVASFINDVWGFMQALVGKAGITPDNTPEKATDSQILDAIEILADNATRLKIQADNPATSVTITQADHNKLIPLTAATAIAVTLGAPVAPFGQVVNIERAGTGNITLTSAVTIDGNVVLSTPGKVATLIAKSATMWKMIT